MPLGGEITPPVEPGILIVPIAYILKPHMGCQNMFSYCVFCVLVGNFIKFFVPEIKHEVGKDHDKVQ